ncbi:MAG TPA: hypothetical protein VF690_04840 [Hymenobacter sp.]|jgi:hypothetical protein
MEKPPVRWAGGFFIKLEGQPNEGSARFMPTKPDLPMHPPRPEQAEPRRGQRLLFLAGLFGVLLNFPLLAVFDRDGRVGGVPVLYVYVLLLWVLLVAITGYLVRGNKE